MDLAVWMTGLGVAVGPALPPFATVLGVPVEYAGRPVFRLAALGSGEHSRSLVRNASDVITVVDASGTVTYQTPSVGWVLGFPPGTLVGTDVHALVHPEDAHDFRGQLAAAVRGLPSPPTA